MKSHLEVQLKHNKCFECCANLAIVLVLVICVVIVCRIPIEDLTKLEGDNFVKFIIACVFGATIVIACITLLLVKIPSVFDTRNMALLDKLQKLEENKSVDYKAIQGDLETQKLKIEDLEKKIGNAQKIEEDKILCNKRVQDFLDSKFNDNEHRLSALAFEHFLDREKLLLMATIFGDRSQKDNNTQA